MTGKKLVIIVIGGLGLLSFAVSFVLSTFLGGSPQPASAGPAGEGASGAQGRALAQMSGLGQPAVLPKAKQLDELIKEVRFRIQEYRRKQEALERREKRLRLAEELLKKQAKDLESLRMELVAPLTGLRETKAKLEQTRILIAKQEETNLKRTAAVYEKMDATSGGGIFVQMCADGQESDAVKILYCMSERAAAKLLAEIERTDQPLAAKLSAMMKRIQPEE